jgi:hypothetical protein
MTHQAEEVIPMMILIRDPMMTERTVMTIKGGSIMLTIDIKDEIPFKT